MYYSMSSNEQCCEARQMEGTSDLITLQSELTRNNDMGAFLLVSWQRRWGLSVTEGAAGEAEYIDQQRGSSSRCRWSHFRLLLAAPLHCPLMLPLAPSMLPLAPSVLSLIPNENGNRQS